jgi:hypothetical protein
VRFQREVRCVRGETPHFDRSVERGRGKGVCVARIDSSHHDVMRVAFKDLDTVKVFVPIPQLDAHIVGTTGEGSGKRKPSD